MSVFFQRMAEVTGEQKFVEAAHELLMEVVGFQKIGNNLNTRGALPGSAPLWGPYARFRYPNWGVKFFLDAMKYVRPQNGEF